MLESTLLDGQGVKLGLRSFLQMFAYDNADHRDLFWTSLGSFSSLGSVKFRV
jgi:hypothetical protein